MGIRCFSFLVSEWKREGDRTYARKKERAFDFVIELSDDVAAEVKYTACRWRCHEASS
jgi:hypothetical protein